MHEAIFATPWPWWIAGPAISAWWSRWSSGHRHRQSTAHHGSERLGEIPLRHLERSLEADIDKHVVTPVDPIELARLLGEARDASPPTRGE